MYQIDKSTKLLVLRIESELNIDIKSMIALIYETELYT